jgi:hypothetical protein
MDAVRISGRLRIEFMDRNGRVERVVKIRNRVVSTGLRWIVDRILNGAVGPSMTYMSIGDSTTAVLPTDTGLAHETARVQLETVPVREEATVGEPSANYTAFFDVGTGTGNVTELALFLSDGTCVARTVIPVQVKSSTTSIRVKWTITLKSV